MSFRKAEVCKAITEDGRLCVNKALRKSHYCRSHQRPGKQKSPRRVWPIVSVGVGLLFIITDPRFFQFLSIVADITGIYSAATQNIPEDVRKGTEHVLREAQEGNEKAQEIVNILRKPEKANSLLRQEFMVRHVEIAKEYPLGYALFYADGTDVFASKSASELIDVEWNGAEILAYTDQYVTLSIPRIKVKHPGRIPNEFETKFALMRGVTDKLQLWRVSMGSMAMSAQILVDKKDYIVGVIGFEKNNN